MLLYRPTLSNGKPVKLLWPIALYRRFNAICWPLADNLSPLVYLLDRGMWLLGFLTFAMTNDAELRFLRHERGNLEEMLSGVPTYLVLIEIHLRAFQLGLHKHRFRAFLQEFYSQYYVEKTTHPRLYQSIRRQLRPSYVLSTMFVLTVLSFFIVPVLNVINHRRDLLYKMKYPIDHTPLKAYVPLVLTNFWIGFIVVTVVFGEATLLAEILLHLNARYVMLREELLRNVEHLLQHADATTIASDYQWLIKRTLQQNSKLNDFLRQIQNEFSFRIFIIFGFSAALLCAIAFIVYTNPMGSFGYVAWGIGKILEILAFGEVSSTLTATTNGISTVYYNSHWELIISKSSNTLENVRLMKLIAMAIELNQKPFYLRGLNFFSVSLRTVVTILQGAGSYFTCLISFR